MTELLDTAERIQSRPMALQSATSQPQRPSDQAERLALLMRNAQDGDRAAYASLLKEILPILKRRVQSRLGFLPIMDREDIVQEILETPIHALADEHRAEPHDRQRAPKFEASQQRGTGR